MAFGPISGGSYDQTVTATAAGIGSGNIPNGAASAEGYVRSTAVVEYRDGTTPTASKGRQWNATDTIILRSPSEMDGFSAIRQSGSNATINWEFYNSPQKNSPPGLGV